MRNIAVALLNMAVLAKAVPQPEPQVHPAPPYLQEETYVVGDGNPQQVYFYKQVSVRWSDFDLLHD